MLTVTRMVTICVLAAQGRASSSAADRTGEEVKVPETRIGALTIAFEILGEDPPVVVTPGARYITDFTQQRSEIGARA
ncbi:Mycobacterium numidiamassiliense ORFan [Mycobacterium numidiamassiliense]|uniref:Mycobacterium numidiamassiliense ORFan n=1 Tax=Mycobacterium numidiamassiliense TaxID=1841861 RepID=A0A2U3PCD7_9MYCO|nr:Mycobacterium numidiamassiliense ORFan [Mycobacterium numidiamassiliense]